MNEDEVVDDADLDLVFGPRVRPRQDAGAVAAVDGAVGRRRAARHAVVVVVAVVAAAVVGGAADGQVAAHDGQVLRQFAQAETRRRQRRFDRRHPPAVAEHHPPPKKKEHPIKSWIGRTHPKSDATVAIDNGDVLDDVHFRPNDADSTFFNSKSFPSRIDRFSLQWDDDFHAKENEKSVPENGTWKQSKENGDGESSGIDLARECFRVVSLLPFN